MKIFVLALYLQCMSGCLLRVETNPNMMQQIADFNDIAYISLMNEAVLPRSTK